MHLQSQLSLHPPTCMFHTQTIKVLHFSSILYKNNNNLIHPGHFPSCSQRGPAVPWKSFMTSYSLDRPWGAGRGWSGLVPGECRSTLRGVERGGLFYFDRATDDFFFPPLLPVSFDPPGGDRLSMSPRKAKRISRSQVMQGAHRHRHPDHPPPSTPLLHTYSEIYRCINCPLECKNVALDVPRIDIGIAFDVNI